MGYAILSGENLIRLEGVVLLVDDSCVDGEEGARTEGRTLLSYYYYFIAIEEVSEGESHKCGIIVGDEVEPRLIQVHKMTEKPDPILRALLQTCRLPPVVY